jgi:hypothetical protein
MLAACPVAFSLSSRPLYRASRPLPVSEVTRHLAAGLGGVFA